MYGVSNTAILWVVILVVAALFISTLRFRKNAGGASGGPSGAEDAEPEPAWGGERIGSFVQKLKQDMETYREMTPALLAETPDERLLEAVLSNLWAKMRPGLTDEREVVRGLSQPRRDLYALYTLTGQLYGEDAPWPPAVEREDLPGALRVLDAVGAVETAALLRSAQANPEEFAKVGAPYTDAFDAEDVRGKLPGYIRANAVGFLDNGL